MAVTEAQSRHDEASPDDYGLHGEPSWLEFDWSKHVHSVEMDGRKATYAEMGDGPPLLLIHGLSGCWQNWLENIPYFARTHRVIAPDLPGFGSSEMPRDSVSICNFARFLDRLLQHLGIERASVVGNSMGGFIGTELTLNFPTYVDKLVLVSAAGVHELPGKATAGQAVRAMSLTQPFTRAVVKRVGFLAGRPRGRRILLSPVCRYPERIKPEMCLEIVAGVDKPAFSAALRDTLSYDFKDRLEEVEVPTLIIWGRNDLVIPVRNADLYERALKNSEKVILEKTGHVAMIERARTFNRLVDEFISR